MTSRINCTIVHCTSKGHALHTLWNVAHSSTSMERKERKRKQSINYDEVRQHVPPVKVGEESLLNISNISDLFEELALDNYTETISDVEDEVVAAKHNCKKDFAVNGTFSHVTFEDSDSDIAPSPRKLLGRTQRPSNVETKIIQGKLVIM